MFVKLQTLGIPQSLCKTIDFIYRNLKFYIKSEDVMSEPFKTSVGLPQGCCLSPTMFSLFVNDIGDCFTHTGLEINGTNVPYLQYADDLVILCESQEELQEQMNNLLQYCKTNCLTLNNKKTKVMIFHKGRIPKTSFYIENEEIEIVQEFRYLGFIFTCQLSFSKHIQALNVKAKARIGLMFTRLPLKELPLSKVMRLFEIYILPIYSYGIALWMTRFAKNLFEQIDTVLLKYLKRYLMIPVHSNNSLTYHITEQTNFTRKLIDFANVSKKNLTFPEEFHGWKLSLWNNIPTADEGKLIEVIPTWFWTSKTYFAIPTNMNNRKKLTNHLFDIKHKEYCSKQSFHASIENDCICKLCWKKLEHFHDRYCEGKIELKELRVLLQRINIADYRKPDSDMDICRRTRKKNRKYFSEEWTNN